MTRGRSGGRGVGGGGLKRQMMTRGGSSGRGSGGGGWR